MESLLSDGLNLFGLFGASRTTRARQGTSRAGPAGGRARPGASRSGPAGEEPARARVGQGMQENEPALDKDFLLSHIKV